MTKSTTKSTCTRSFSFVKKNQEASILLSNHKALEIEVQRLREGSPHIVADVYYSIMTTEMEQVACDTAVQAMKNYQTEQLIAKFMKETFDKIYGKAWQCVCGKHFGSYVTFEPDSFIYFRIGAMAFILFRAIEISTDPSPAS
ncbi:unnamed protein product [Auanema sp. JU1783]|nr:unnamed protein product [Auanema sp. JU1783]